ncbi:MAG TPA: hypothetical protein PLU71_03935 [Candidatus Dependentiae bacterium]|nr:hypothetical protein [Candidatus Dependentiae bacterium]HRQ62982.1 hypothetical protein [Candidatus Dependentiae bacterium]
MNKHSSLSLLVLSFLLFCMPIYAKISGKQGNFEYDFSGKFRPEMFYGKNVNLLNNNTPHDQTWYMRHTLDATLDVLYGAATYDRPVAEVLFTLRNKATWGNKDSITRTTDADIKDIDVVGSSHSHALPRLIFWMREGWLRFDLEAAMGLGLVNKHDFTIGAFPFELGRGIALGDAYAVNGGVLGFYTDNVVDQYAFGAKLSGEIVKDILYYDLYTAILQNNSSSFGDINRRILGQEYGKRLKPERGFGKINYVVAGRFQWYVFDSEKFGTLMLEPYGLFNNDPEQKVEFLGDASSRLGTIGAALEYEHRDIIDFGFEYALNLGNQKVKGWDRNSIRFAIDADTGFVKEVNTHVVNGNGNDVTFNPASSSGRAVQKAINESYQNESQNSQEFAVVDGMELINKSNRFRNPYTNIFEGWMFVADFSTWIYKKDLKLSMAVGLASGDDNPNEETIDGNYTGFIPLQSIYSGKRVRSSFVLGGKLRRPLEAPQFEQAPSKFAQEVSDFTNLIYTGMALDWEPKGWEKNFKLNPNVLAYWQEKPTRKFDAFTKTFLDELASTYLGLELNLFAHYFLLKDLRLFFVGAVVFPGSHYTDIKGIPLNAEQDRALDRLDAVAGNDRIPNLGDDTAFTFNLGLEFKF